MERLLRWVAEAVDATGDGMDVGMGMRAAIMTTATISDLGGN